MVKVGCTYHGTLGVILSFKKPASNVYTAVYSEYRVQQIHEIWGGGLILGLPRNPRIFSLHEFGLPDGRNNKTVLSLCYQLL
jgi:hypothetical protein